MIRPEPGEASDGTARHRDPASQGAAPATDAQRDQVRMWNIGWWRSRWVTQGSVGTSARDGAAVSTGDDCDDRVPATDGTATPTGDGSIRGRGSGSTEMGETSHGSVATDGGGCSSAGTERVMGPPASVTTSAVARAPSISRTRRRSFATWAMRNPTRPPNRKPPPPSSSKAPKPHQRPQKRQSCRLVSHLFPPWRTSRTDRRPGPLFLWR